MVSRRILCWVPRNIPDISIASRSLSRMPTIRSPSGPTDSSPPSCARRTLSAKPSSARRRHTSVTALASPTNVTKTWTVILDGAIQAFVFPSWAVVCLVMKIRTATLGSACIFVVQTPRGGWITNVFVWTMRSAILAAANQPSLSLLPLVLLGLGKVQNATKTLTVSVTTVPGGSDALPCPMTWPISKWSITKAMVTLPNSLLLELLLGWASSFMEASSFGISGRMVTKRLKEETSMFKRRERKAKEDTYRGRNCDKCFVCGRVPWHFAPNF
mmetsp:Transcript_34543/g.101519  ORF Transcript_34543/g.101519 Transcript_34543/m.101519 type:complete len:272 (+) Transcript_34543:880-1695(+)